MTTNTSLEELAEKCWTADGQLKKSNEEGTGYYCFCNPDNISTGTFCKYQGDLIVSRDNKINVQCNFRDLYSKRMKRTKAFLMEGC
jgi:hypothetical protein